jgi:peptidoglycan/xylan/chitin deacetylase (PgdA/CDA1 family)
MKDTIANVKTPAPVESASARLPRLAIHPGMKRTAGRVLRVGARVLRSPFTAAARRYFGVVRAVTSDRPVLALTFDDGPHPESTPEVLRILDKYRAKATFFMVGELAARHTDVVRAAAQAGHVVANHSWSHVSFPLMSARERYEQLRRCEDALSPYGAKLFRPPYCHQTLASRWNARRAGYDVVIFNVHAEDWLPRPAEWMADKLVREARPGAIVILHDNIYGSVLAGAETDRRPMLRALDSALDRLQERFLFVTVPDLLRQGPVVREIWESRGSAEMRVALEQHALGQRRLSRLERGRGMP